MRPAVPAAREVPEHLEPRQPRIIPPTRTRPRTAFHLLLLPAARLPAITGAGILIRLSITGQNAAVFAWLAGALFLPALAFASGIISGTGKVFEALLTLLWYIGPMNHVPGIDFTGAASGPQTIHYALIYLGMTAALLVLAVFARSRQLRSN